MIVARWIWIQKKKKKILPARPPPWPALVVSTTDGAWSIMDVLEVLRTRSTGLVSSQNHSYSLVQRAHMIFRYDGTLQWRFDRTIQRPPHANVWRAVRNLAEGVVSGVSS